MAAVQSPDKRRALYTGSTQALAITAAPLRGPILVSYASTIASNAAASTNCLSTSSDSSAFALSSSSEGGLV